MFDYFKLKSPIGRSYNTNPDDVRKIKKALSGLGYYDELEHGITPYPDAAMILGIEKFQRDNGLKSDGVMKPDGETMWMLGSVVGDIFTDAQNLQSMGRNGDTLLAHINPREARLLKRHGGSGTVNPVTGLLEFSKTGKKEGKYIWHTQGDGKVRDSHAENDGKTFSWDSPPDTGHPGEDYNCRCWAEDIEDTCVELEMQMVAAWAAHDELQQKRSDLNEEQAKVQNELEEVRSMDPREFISDEDYEGTESEYWLGRKGAKWFRKKTGGAYDYHQKRTIGLMIQRERIRELTQRLHEIKEELAALEKERQKLWDNAVKASDLFKAQCDGETDKNASGKALL